MAGYLQIVQEALRNAQKGVSARDAAEIIKRALEKNKPPKSPIGKYYVETSPRIGIGEVRVVLTGVGKKTIWWGLKRDPNGINGFRIFEQQGH